MIHNNCILATSPKNCLGSLNYLNHILFSDEVDQSQILDIHYQINNSRQRKDLPYSLYFEYVCSFVFLDNSWHHLVMVSLLRSTVDMMKQLFSVRVSNYWNQSTVLRHICGQLNTQQNWFDSQIANFWICHFNAYISTAKVYRDAIRHNNCCIFVNDAH